MSNMSNTNLKSVKWSTGRCTSNSPILRVIDTRKYTILSHTDKASLLK